jgi:nucleotide-binding universal stress UspA family protein
MAINAQSQQVLDQQHPQPDVMSSPYHRILVAVDYLDGSPEVLEEALKLGKIHGSQLKIFYCVQGRIHGFNDLPLYAGMAGYGSIYTQEMVELEEKLIQETVQEVQTWLKRLTQKALDEGVQAEADYAYGDAGGHICSLAAKWDADLIVVGRRGRSGLSELLLGSVSNYVVHHAPCSILIVQH